MASLPDVPASESGKQFPAPVSELPPVILHIGKGIYREKLVITRPNITFEGTGGDETILVYGDAAFDLMPEGISEVPSVLLPSGSTLMTLPPET